MIVCRQCGEHNDPGSPFCKECNAFLEWEGEAVEEEVPWWQREDAAAQEKPKRRWWKKDA